MHLSVWLCPLAEMLKKLHLAYNILENSQIKPLARIDQINDLGILLDERLSFRDHINDKINKAFSMLGIFKLNFKHLTIQSFVLYKTW